MIAAASVGAKVKSKAPSAKAQIAGAIEGILQRQVAKKAAKVPARPKPTRSWALSAMVYEVTSGKSAQGHVLWDVLAKELDSCHMAGLLVALSRARPGAEQEKAVANLNAYTTAMAMRYFKSPALREDVARYQKHDLIIGDRADV